MSLVLAALLAAGAGCARSKVVTRVKVDTPIDLSGVWNDTDSRQVAEALIAQATGKAWVEEFRTAKSRQPVVIVGQIRNKSAEHVPVATFIADLERSFMNSGNVKVVATAEEREGVRAEREDQQRFASQETMKRWGRERGADLMLLGEINSIFDREGGTEVKYYQVDTYLVDLEDNTKVWSGFEKIKKVVSRGAYRP